MLTDNYKELAKNNSNFRMVLYTGTYSQVVAMSLPAGTEIGEETHPGTDQIFMIIEGHARANVGDESHALAKKDILFVPAGSVHNITNTGHEDVKLLTIYAPPQHPEGTVEATKPTTETV